MSQISHLKIHGFSGDQQLVRCEDDGCTVDEHGRANCGRLACPSCGFSGSNLSAPDGFDGDTLARCDCGYAWTPERARITVAA
jgi:hypothetical protein